MTCDELLAEYAKGRRDCSGANLRGATLPHFQSLREAHDDA